MTATIGILGAGRVGTAIARQALRAGFRVLVAASGDPADIELIVAVMAPGAHAVAAAQAAAAADVVVLSLPLRRYATLDPAMLDGKIVIDAMNHWPDSDGHIPALDDATSSSQLVQDFLPGAHVVKTLNHIGYHDLETDHAPPGATRRRALAVAGDDQHARTAVMDVVERLGYDAVDVGPLAAGVMLEPGTEIFTGRHDRASLRAAFVVEAD